MTTIAAWIFIITFTLLWIGLALALFTSAIRNFEDGDLVGLLPLAIGTLIISAMIWIIGNILNSVDS